LLAPPPTPKLEDYFLTAVLVQYIRTYPPYLEAVFSIRNLRTRQAVVTRESFSHMRDEAMTPGSIEPGIHTTGIFHEKLYVPCLRSRFRRFMKCAELQKTHEWPSASTRNEPRSSRERRSET
jgi:hypothetical protein